VEPRAQRTCRDRPEAKVVHEFVASIKVRLKLLVLSAYSPLLNPDEWVWRTSNMTASDAQASPT